MRNDPFETYLKPVKNECENGVWGAVLLRVVRAGAVLCLGTFLASASSPALAERQHRVQAGQTLTSIARKHGVTVWSLAGANGLAPDGTVRAGQTLNVPEKGIVYVNAGQTLWSVARRHDCTVEALARANGITTSSSLRPGMRLRIPGSRPSREHGRSAEASTKSTGSKWRPGQSSRRVRLHRVATGEEVTLTLVDKRGRSRRAARNRLRAFLRPRNSKQTRLPDPRLVGLLARTVEHFEGRKVHVVSGYREARGYTKKSSRHVAGAAIDFRIEGVSNKKLCDYLRHFDDVGVGFYPHSTFVHLDVRDSNAYWVDLSRPGKQPLYLSREQRDVYHVKDKSPELAKVGALVADVLADMEHGEPDLSLADDE